MITEQQRSALAADLPKDAVRSRSQGGQSLSYIESWWAIARANEVFGHDGWSYEVRATRVLADYERAGNSGKNRVVLYEATVRVHALGTFREDVGVGVCDANAANPAQGIEKASKEAVSDALKRCLRTFGMSFGLALYDKTQEHVGASSEAQALMAELAGITVLNNLGDWWKATAGRRKALDEADHAELESAWKRRRSEVTEARDAAAAEREAAATRQKAAEQKTQQAKPTEAPKPESKPAPKKDEPKGPPAALAALYTDIARLDVTGDAVATWRKHRAAIEAAAHGDRVAAWSVLCARVNVIGKMQNGHVWLKRAIAEADATAGRRGDPPAATHDPEGDAEQQAIAQGTDFSELSDDEKDTLFVKDPGAWAAYLADPERDSGGVAGALLKRDAVFQAAGIYQARWEAARKAIVEREGCTEKKANDFIEKVAARKSKGAQASEARP